MNKLKLSLIVAPILALSLLLYKVYEKPYNVVDEQAMEEISNEVHITVGQDTFLDPRGFSQEVANAMLTEGVWQLSPFGPIWAGDIFKKEFTLLIDSNGGSVDVMFQILDSMAELQKRGIHFKCYIANAHSAAFTFAVSVCSKAILLRGGQMSQHHAYRRGFGITNDTYLISLNMAKKEAAALLLDYREWMRITRDGNEDKLFSVEELKKYNIIQKVYGE